MECCPTCGSPLSDHASWNLEDRSLIANGIVVRFTKTEARIFDTLWRWRSRGPVPDREALMQMVYADDADGGPNSFENLSVLLIKVRKKLKGSGFAIPRAYGRPRIGYRLVREVQ